MADDIDITSGGAVAVDTASLEHAAAGLDVVADDLDDLAARAAQVTLLLESAAAVSGSTGVHRARRAAASLGEATGSARLVAGRLRQSARIYEIVELTNQRDLACAAGDRARERAAADELALARAADPVAAGLADDAIAEWRQRSWADTAAVARDPLLLIDPLTAWLLGLVAPVLVGARGGGLVPRGRTPTGPAPAVQLRAIPIAPRTPVAAPSSLAAMVLRVPDGRPAGRDTAGAARVRVERYEFPDGSREFAVYVAGTQQWSDGLDEPFDARSNGQLYEGQDSASYEAVRSALDAAGARPGDGLDLVGFSQGGMVASWFAQDATYDVRGLVAAGSPVVADLPEDIPYVVLEHRDDPVPALQGAWDVADGDADVVRVERTVDPAPGLQDVLLPAHRLDEYAKTAHLFEKSGDPRFAPFQEMLGRLAGATAVTTTEYAVTRVR